MINVSTCFLRNYIETQIFSFMEMHKLSSVKWQYRKLPPILLWEESTGRHLIERASNVESFSCYAAIMLCDKISKKTKHVEWSMESNALPPIHNRT